MKTKKLLSILLALCMALCMVLCLLPAGAVAAYADNQNVPADTAAETDPAYAEDQDIPADADPADLTGTISPEGEIYYKSYLENGNETIYTVSVRNNDYETGGKSTGSYLSLDSASLVKTGSFAAGETVTIHVNMQPGTGFYHMEGYDDGPSVWKADASEQLDVTKVDDTTYTFVMPEGDVNVSGRFTFINYTVQVEGYNGGIAGLRGLLTSVNGTTVQNTSPFTAQYGDSIEIDTYGDAKFVTGISYTYTENGQTVTKTVTDVQQPNKNQYVGTFSFPGILSP